MGLRAYLLVDVADDIKQPQFTKAVKELEAMPEVDLVSPVIGHHDIVVMVDAPAAVETVVEKIRSQVWAKAVEILRIVSLNERHHASKKEQLHSLG